MKDQELDRWLKEQNDAFLGRIAGATDPADRLRRVMSTAPHGQGVVAERAHEDAPPRHVTGWRRPVIRWALIAGSFIGIVGVALLVTFAGLARPETLDERVDTAIADLGNPELEKRAKGVETLGDVTQQYAELRRYIFEELTRLVRQQAPLIGNRGCALGISNVDVANAVRIIVDPTMQPDLTGTESNYTIDLSKVCLAGMEAPRASLAGADLSYSYLYEADLKGAVFVQGNLTGAVLTGADLTDADLNNAQLVRATMERTILAGARLPYANLIGADLSEARLDRTVLFEADLTGADLRGANLAGADLRGARLVGTDLREANLTGVNLTGADLSGAKGVPGG